VGAGPWPPTALIWVLLLHLQSRILQHLVLATLGCWKIGAVPIPMHWDLPEWERNRVREVIDPRRVRRRKEPVGKLDARAAGESDSPVPTTVSPQCKRNLQQRLNRRAQSDPQLAPSLWTPSTANRFLSAWTPVAQPPEKSWCPHRCINTNGFATFLFLLAGDHLVVLEKFHASTGFGRGRTLSDHQFISRRRQRCWRASQPGLTSGSETCPASSSSCRAPP